jgi:ectoine hydroxylase-related dioxygenase (phytanoyl-CoA dioxygenase family)
MLNSAQASHITHEMAASGWVVTEPVVSPGETDRLIDALTPIQTSTHKRGGLRNLFAVPEVRSLAQSSSVRAVAEAVLGASCIAVKATLFDKTPQANWKVSWHQDVTIAVRERASVDGFNPWSEKDGTPHVQPPAHVLEQMLAVRIHLDDCGLENGPVRVIPGSHRSGRLSDHAIDVLRTTRTPVACVAARGAILASRPLLLHASSPATSPGHRRVVHLEFAAGPLTDGLTWADEIPRR